MTDYVIGLDGADWSLIEKFVSEGSLPTFERVIESGAVGRLESTLPPITSPAWMSYATGKNPGKLGVYGWVQFDESSKEISFPDATSFKSKTYWDVLGADGIKTGVVNMPTTDPPITTDTNVLMISGKGGSTADQFTDPECLGEDLLNEIPDYRISMNADKETASTETILKDVCEMFDQRFQAARWLANEHECEFVHTTLFYTDQLQHKHYTDHDVLVDAYVHIDRLLDGLLEKSDTDTVFLLSDHGFTAATEAFLPNQWLLERGDLVIGDDQTGLSLAQLLRMLQIDRNTAVRIAKWAGIYDLVKSTLPDSIKESVPVDVQFKQPHHLPIDWAKTKAIALGHGPIYVNSAAFPETHEKRQYIKSLRSDLEKLTTPNGTPVTNKVHPGTEIYEGNMGTAPDLLVEYTDGIDSSSISIGGETFNSESRLNEWEGMHRRTGIFAAYGMDITNVNTDLSIQDVAPSILRYLNAPIPVDVDGDVQYELFDNKFNPADERHGEPSEFDPAVTEGGVEPSRDVEADLKKLGYLE